MAFIPRIQHICLSILLLGLFLYNAAPAKCPVADLNGDCQVDLADLVVLAGEWLDPAVGGGLNQFMGMSQNWLVSGVPVAINEYMASNSGFIPDPDDPGEDYADWIELYNYGDYPVDLGGFYVTDDLAAPQKVQIPADRPELTTLAPGEFMLLWADKDPEQGPLHLDFNLSAGGEDIGLFTAAGVEVDALSYEAMTTNQSRGRLPDGFGAWQTFNPGTTTEPTPGQPNGTPSLVVQHNVVLNEIMYHPLLGDDRKEYIELYNRGEVAVNLLGWRFVDCVDFTFPDVTLDSGGYLIVTADAGQFAADYPEVTCPVLGNWTGHLSNTDEAVVLANAAGRIIETAHYYDDGEWAQRYLGPVDYSHRGWLWSGAHDGEGSSLQRINPLASNDLGQNWSASAIEATTPGRQNANHSTVSAPFILEARHAPAIPNSHQPVAVQAKIADDLDQVAFCRLHWRIDQSTYSQNNYVYTTTGYSTVEMAIDTDGLYKGTIPPQADRAVVEFYLEAQDSDGNRRTWPAPCLVDGERVQAANGLYQVDDSFDPNSWLAEDSQAGYFLVMTNQERLRLKDIGDSSESEKDSNALMNTTFISVDQGGTKVRYLTGARNRGHGSRTYIPNNIRINFRHDQVWQGNRALNLNTVNTWLQVAGSRLFHDAGLVAANTKAVQVRVNGENLAKPGAAQYGSYVHLQVMDSVFADDFFPDDSDGNIYKCMRQDSPAIYADLQYRGENADAYRNTYFKATNESRDNWTDLINLTHALSGDLTDAEYIAAAERMVDADQWLRFLAFMALLDNRETSIGSGQGDDYYLYANSAGERFTLLPHDLDTILGTGSSTCSPTNPIFPAMQIATLDKLIRHPRHAERYYFHLKDLIDTVLAPEPLALALQESIGSYAPQSEIDKMMNFAAQRNAFVLSQIPSELTVEVDLPVVNGKYTTTSGSLALSGAAPAVGTQAVTVNGLVAQWQPFECRWGIGDSAAGQTETLVGRGSDWYYLDNGSNQYQIQDGAIWYGHPDYVQTGWKGPSPAPLGYSNPVATTISYGPSSSNKYTTSYFRKTFTVDQPERYSGLTLRVMRDDSVVIFINGQLAVYDHIGSNPTYDTWADQPAVDGSNETAYYEFTVDPGLLMDGINLIAAEVHQVNATSSDVSFDMDLNATLAGNGNENVPLQPGLNTITVQTWGSQDPPTLLAETAVEVVFVPELSGALAQDTTLAAGSVWHVTGDVTVPTGRTLTIEPGVTLQFNTGTGITVNGLLSALGTEAQPISMVPTPGTATRWDGLRFTNSLQPNRVSHVNMEYGDQQGESVQVASSRAVLEYITFKVTNNGTQILDFDHPRAIVRGCNLPVISGVEPIHGTNLSGNDYMIFTGNVFGGTSGYNDMIDFTGGKRPGPIIQFYDNIFMGGGDDGVDLDGTDGHVEGNLFMNFHQTTPTQDSPSYGVATDASAKVCVARNTFINNDHGILHKNDVYCWIQNNTIINSTMAAISFGEPFRSSPTQPGRGCYIDSNICWNNAAMFEHYFDNPVGYGPTGPVYIYRSIVPAEWLGFGGDNTDADPLFVNGIDDLNLQAGSPALGAGANGMDMGAMVPPGASIAGAPASPTSDTTATLTVAGPGVMAYRYRIVDNGVRSDWSDVLALPITPDDYPADPDTVVGTLELTGLQAGHTYRVEVIGQNSAGLWQGQVFGDTDFVAPGDPDGASTPEWTIVP